MGTLYISEYADTPLYAGQIVLVGNEPAVAEQAVAITGSSGQSAAFNAKTLWVRVHTDTTCSILFGANPTAVTTAKRLVANSTEFFGVEGGQKLAVILNT